MENTISFVLDGKIRHINFSKEKYAPTTTVLNYLRSLPGYKGAKEGCAEGDCGACTVVIAQLNQNGSLEYNAVNSCLLFLPRLHGKQLITVEELADTDANLHPVQQAMVDHYGSQCGFCTPGIVMSLFALYKKDIPVDRGTIEEHLSGNLCRCTGYQSILNAAEAVLKNRTADKFTESEQDAIKQLKSIPARSLSLSNNEEAYYLPADLKELLQLRNKYPDAQLINGASDAALRVTKQFERLPLVIDCSNVRELQQIEENKNEINIGSGVNINQILQSAEKDFTALFDICIVFGSHPIRNAATIGGNLGTASPIGDLMPVLAAYNADIILESINGRRTVPADDFITGYRQTQMQGNEIIHSIRLPMPPADTAVKMYKISRRKELDISTLSAAFRLKLDKQQKIKEIKIIYGGMAACTKHAVKAEQFLTGRTWSQDTAEQTAEIIRDEFEPISDARADAEFRSLAAGNLLLKFWSDTP